MSGPLRVAIAGAGKLGRTHARHWQAIAGAELVAVLDHHAEAASALARDCSPGGSASGFTDWEQMLASARPTVLDICTPTPTHREMAEQGAARGLALFVEKPLARTLADCDAIAEAVARAGVPCMAGHVVRWFPAYREAKQIVDAGGVGKPAVVRAERLMAYPHRQGEPGWYADPEQSGGVVLDALLHDFDWLLWCFGPVVRVFAHGLHGQPGMDYALVMLRLASGALAHLTGSWAHAGPMRSGFEIAGDTGMLDYDSARDMPLTLTRRGHAPVTESPRALSDDPYFCELAAFADAVQRGVPPPVTVNEAREAVRVALAALESVQTGKAVTLA